jgi:hypothetical protein
LLAGKKMTAEALIIEFLDFLIQVLWRILTMVGIICSCVIVGFFVDKITKIDD